MEDLLWLRLLILTSNEYKKEAPLWFDWHTFEALYAVLHIVDTWTL
jgi:hypothetical protein